MARLHLCFYLCVYLYLYQTCHGLTGRGPLLPWLGWGRAACAVGVQVALPADCPLLRACKLSPCLQSTPNSWPHPGAPPQRRRTLLPTLTLGPAVSSPSPQVAAHSQHHICVRKGTDASGRMVTCFDSLREREARLQEVSAMLGESLQAACQRARGEAQSVLCGCLCYTPPLLGGPPSACARAGPQACPALHCPAGLPLSAAEELMAAAEPQ